ncbi:uncharacterized protein LOC143325471 [Chaetodon auriga]|uniref:uncharacterized protein LOC143325471 n=1 Tax=Chaetodon auriga TaxID=39042 RepID=UPI0040328ED5
MSSATSMLASTGTTNNQPPKLLPTQMNSPSHSPLMYSALSRVNFHKVAGPGGISDHVLKASSEKLAGVFTDIFNLSLVEAAVTTCLKTTIIVLVPKQSAAVGRNDFRPVTLTRIITKFFERLVLAHLKCCPPSTLDPHQIAYHANGSTKDAISMALHSTLDNTHLDNNNTNERMLFIDFSSAFNTVIPSKLVNKLNDLGISTSLCNWTLDFLTKFSVHG